MNDTKTHAAWSTVLTTAAQSLLPHLRPNFLHNACEFMAHYCPRQQANLTPMVGMQVAAHSLVTISTGTPASQYANKSIHLACDASQQV